MINEFLLKDFGQRIKMLRTKENLSQEALAASTGFHRTYIGMIERGERNISLINIAVFAKVFEMSVSELLDLNNVEGSRTFKDYELKVETNV
ncbi:helix-turn-helix domain-containing protein [Mucilaginibacter sp.]|uniref:helix-turn-helix domain-containing protein n=1 Tax=Mucilaginibacter sp. TaxID=1882438 RepID=UPI000CAE0801|nr:helix-turn-helix transcriptional regulator [Mucilaginibacter sp.]PLW89630.1 MAG: XRE family transcriptional regulator [Mucilaginibacter sp.]HEK19773.1 XRE family transcriptional regulator [Bacteroidota bacterium]